MSDMIEDRPETKKTNLIEIFTRNRISIPKLAFWVILLIIMASIVITLKPKYPRNSPDQDFKFGYSFPGGYVFPFYYDLEYGIQFIDPGDRVYSNIELYVLAKTNQSLDISVLLFKQINETYSIKVYNLTKEVNIEGFKWDKIDIEMPHDDSCMFLAKLFVNDKLIVTFYYRFNILTSTIQTTLGDMLISQILYLIIGFIIMLVGMLVAKSVSKKYPSPEPDLATGGYFLVFAGIFLYLVCKELVITYGLVNASIMYIPFFIISILAGFYIVGDKPRKVLLLNVKEDSLMVNQDVLKYRKIEGELYIVPSLVEFLLYKPTKLNLTNYNLVFKCLGEYDYVIYYQDLKREGTTLKVKVSDIHHLRLEEYKTNAQKILAMSEAIEKQKKKIKDLEIEKIVRTGEEAIEIIKKLFKIDLEEK